MFLQNWHRICCFNNSRLCASTVDSLKWTCWNCVSRASAQDRAVKDSSHFGHAVSSWLECCTMFQMRKYRNYDILSRPEDLTVSCVLYHQTSMINQYAYSNLQHLLVGPVRSSLSALLGLVVTKASCSVRRTLLAMTFSKFLWLTRLRCSDWPTHTENIVFRPTSPGRWPVRCWASHNRCACTRSGMSCRPWTTREDGGFKPFYCEDLAMRNRVHWHTSHQPLPASLNCAEHVSAACPRRRYAVGVAWQIELSASPIAA